MMRYNNVEFRQNGVKDSHGYTIDEDRPSEIIAWIYSESLGEETCITICWLKRGKEGFYMETIGNRFTEYEDSEALMHVTRYALRILDTQFEFEEKT